VPCEDGFGFDDQKDIGPTGPEATEDDPKEPVPRMEGRPWALPFEHGDLLAKGEDFQG